MPTKVKQTLISVYTCWLSFSLRCKWPFYPVFNVIPGPHKLDSFQPAEIDNFRKRMHELCQDIITVRRGQVSDCTYCAWQLSANQQNCATPVSYHMSRNQWLKACWHIFISTCFHYKTSPFILFLKLYVWAAGLKSLIPTHVVWDWCRTSAMLFIRFIFF